MKIVIFGANGMLGHKLFQILIENFNYEVFGTIRSQQELKYFNKSVKKKIICGIKTEADFENVFKKISPDLIINCIGITTKSQDNLIEMINVNSKLPHQFLNFSNKYAARMIHISTDCVFSGKIGNYSEDDLEDPNDYYGRSKLLGEFYDPKHLVIRTSIIGPEFKTKRGLLEWFLGVSEECNGYEEAFFNGLTTLELSKVIGKYIIPRYDISGLVNISSNPISKANLLTIINKIYKKDVKINFLKKIKIDRSLNSKKFYNYTKYICPDWENLIYEMYLDSR